MVKRNENMLKKWVKKYNDEEFKKNKKEMLKLIEDKAAARAAKALEAQATKEVVSEMLEEGLLGKINKLVIKVDELKKENVEMNELILIKRDKKLDEKLFKVNEKVGEVEIASQSLQQHIKDGIGKEDDEKIENIEKIIENNEIEKNEKIIKNNEIEEKKNESSDFIIEEKNEKNDIIIEDEDNNVGISTFQQVKNLFGMKNENGCKKCGKELKLNKNGRCYKCR